MAIEPINPPGLMPPQGYAQLAVATGSRTIYLAGQTGHDADGNVVGVGDLAAQAEQAWINVSIALEAAGASMADIAKVTLYIVGWKPEMFEALLAGSARAAERVGLELNRPATLIGVETLFAPELLIEVDVIAVVG